MRASRSALARRSSRWVRALAIAEAAWEANSISTSSSASVNASSVRLVGKEEAADVGAAVTHRRALEAAREHRGGLDAKLLRTHSPTRSVNRTGSGRSRRCSNSLTLCGHAASSSSSSGVKPEVRKSCGTPASSTRTSAPQRAPVSARALSITSSSTVSRSRLALIRRMAALRVALRARSASISRFRSSDSAKGVSRVRSSGLAPGRAGDAPTGPE